MSRNSYTGYIDAVENGIIVGWALDRSNPSNSTYVDVYLDGILIRRHLANISRPDLLSISPSSERKGFRIDIAAELGERPFSKIAVMHSGTLIPIPFSSADSAQIDMQALLVAKPSPWVPVPPFEIVKYITGDANPQSQHLSYLMSGMINAADIINICLSFGLNPRNPGFKILDLGCGCGRLSSFLAQFLPESDYYGVDVQKASIEWATNNITSRFPNFKFVSLDTRDTYAGSKAYEIKISGPFDLVMATSLFTHLEGAAIVGYVSQSRHLLKKDGLGYFTFFMLDSFSEKAADTAIKRSGLASSKTNDGWWFGDGSYLDIYYRRPAIERLVREGGMNVIHVRPGYWSVGKTASDNTAAYQDLLVARPSA